MPAAKASSAGNNIKNWKCPKCNIQSTARDVFRSWKISAAHSTRNKSESWKLWRTQRTTLWAAEEDTSRARPCVHIYFGLPWDALCAPCCWGTHPQSTHQPREHTRTQSDVVDYYTFHLQAFLFKPGWVLDMLTDWASIRMHLARHTTLPLRQLWYSLAKKNGISLKILEKWTVW